MLEAAVSCIEPVGEWVNIRQTECDTRVVPDWILKTDCGEDMKNGTFEYSGTAGG